MPIKKTKKIKSIKHSKPKAKGAKSMEKVKIKRRKRVKKKVSTKAKILSGIGVGSTLMGGVGAVAPKPPTTQFVRTEESKKQSSTGKIKDTLKRIFGVKEAKAAEVYSYDFKDNSNGTYTVTLNDQKGTSLTVSSRNELASKSQKYNTTDTEDIKKFSSFTKAYNNWNNLISGSTNTPADNSTSDSSERTYPTVDSRTPSTRGRESNVTPTATALPSIASVVSKAVNSSWNSLSSVEQGVFANHFSGGQNTNDIPGSFGKGSAFAYALGWGGASNGNTQTLGSRTFKLSGGQWNVVVQQQQDQGQDQKQQTVSSSRVASIINSANTTSWGSLSSAERSAVQDYLTSNTSALTDKNFNTFTPGSVLSWALGMGTSTNLNAAAKSLGFTTYEGGQFSKTQQQQQQDQDDDKDQENLDINVVIAKAASSPWGSLTGDQNTGEQGVFFNHFSGGQNTNDIPDNFGKGSAFAYALNWGSGSEGDTKTLGNRTFVLTGNQWRVGEAEGSNTPAISGARVNSILNNANTIIWSFLPSAEREAVQTYLTSNPNALSSKTFGSFIPGSVFAWALGMGTSTSLNNKAKGFGFVRFDAQSGTFVKMQVKQAPPKLDLNNLPNSFVLGSDTARALGLSDTAPVIAEGNIPAKVVILGENFYEFRNGQYNKLSLEEIGNNAPGLIVGGKYYELINGSYQLKASGKTLENLLNAGAGVGAGIAAGTVVAHFGTTTIGAFGTFSTAGSAIPFFSVAGSVAEVVGSVGGALGFSGTAAIVAGGGIIGAGVAGAIIGIRAIMNKGQDKVRDTKRIESAYPYFDQVVKQYYAIRPQSSEEADQLHKAAVDAIQGIFDQIKFEKDSSRKDQQRWLQTNYFNPLQKTLNQWKQAFNKDLNNLEVYEMPSGVRMAYVAPWGQVRVSADGQLLSWENVGESSPAPSVISAIARKSNVTKVNAPPASPVAVQNKYSDAQLIAGINSIMYTGPVEFSSSQLQRINSRLGVLPQNVKPGSVLSFMLGLGSGTDGVTQRQGTNGQTYKLSGGFWKLGSSGTADSGQTPSIQSVIAKAASSPWSSLTGDQSSGEQGAFYAHFSGGQNTNDIPDSFGIGSAFAYALNWGSGSIGGTKTLGNRTFELKLNSQNQKVWQAQTPSEQPGEETPPAALTMKEALKVMQEFNKPGADFSNPRYLEAYKVVYGRPHNLDPGYAEWAQANPAQNNVPQSGFREESSRDPYYPGQKVVDERAIANGTPTVSELLNVEGLNFVPQWEDVATGYNSYDDVPMGFNTLFFAKEATARQLAEWLGGEYIPASSYTGGPYTIPTGAQIKIGDKYFNAGFVAKEFQRLQQTYKQAVKNYEQNLAQNPNIIGTGYLTPPTNPVEALRGIYLNTGGPTNTSVGSTAGIDYSQPYLPGSAKAKAAQANSPQAVILNNTSGNTTVFKVGESWNIRIVGAPNTDVFVVGGKDGEQARTKMGTTDANGILNLSGTMKAGEKGEWAESWFVGEKNAGQINFKVVGKSAVVKEEAANVESVIPGVDTSTVVLNPGKYNFTYFKNPTLTLPNGDTSPHNPLFYPTLETAQKVADLLGGKVAFAGGAGYSHPQYGILFSQAPKMFMGAGLLAQKIERDGVKSTKKSVNAQLKGNENEYSLYNGVSTGSLADDLKAMQSGAKEYYAYGDQSVSNAQEGGYAISQENISSASTLPLSSPLQNDVSDENQLVFVSYVAALNEDGISTGVIKPGHTIEIGGQGLEAYSQFQLVAGNQAFGIVHSTITNNKITLVVPEIGNIPNNTNLQVSLISTNPEVRSGVLPQIFIYNNSASAPSIDGAGEQAESGALGTGFGGDNFGNQTVVTGDPIKAPGIGMAGSQDLPAVGDSNTPATVTDTISPQLQTALNELSTEVASLNNRITELSNQVDNVSVHTNEENNPVDLSGVQSELAALRNEIVSLNTLVNNIKSGQVSTFAQVEGMATGLQMPAGYPASSSILGGGLQMPSGYPASNTVPPATSGGLQMPPGSATGDSSAVEQTYRVKKGDSLWKISKKYYGEGRKWRTLLKANPNSLSKPGNTRTLKVGFNLIIPPAN